MTGHSTRHAAWGELSRDDLYEIVRLRYRVFALEQRVADEDFDGRDREPDTEHWWTTDDAARSGAARSGAAVGSGAAVAYLRLIRPAPAEAHLASWVIGRVAVDRAHRGRGLAQDLVAAVLAAHGHEPILLHAQEYVTGLYARSGFVPFGEPYVEAGIRHVGMRREGAPV